MSLFKLPDLQHTANAASPKVKSASSTELQLDLTFAPGKTKQQISERFGTLKPSKSIFFHTEGAWSNIHLLEYILHQIGTSKVYFSTWSISIAAIRCLKEWQENDLISDLFAVLDRGIRNRKPEIYQQCVANFENLKFAKCHAKVCVIENKNFSFTLMGSANFTENPRIEAGILIEDQNIASQNIEWILKALKDE